MKSLNKLLWCDAVKPISTNYVNTNHFKEIIKDLLRFINHKQPKLRASLTQFSSLADPYISEEYGLILLIVLVLVAAVFSPL